jgi:hypothetical protein
MWLGSNGARDRWAWWEMMAHSETTTRTSISNPKNTPASRVETATPRTIMTTETAVSNSVQMIKGTSRPM